MIRFLSRSTRETEEFAAAFAEKLRPGDVIAAAAAWARAKPPSHGGLARGLGLTDEVSSPTFALVHEYTHGNILLYHFDMYRVSGFDELYSTGFFRLSRAGRQCSISEWSENIEGALPAGAITLTLERVDDDTRQLTIEGERF